MTHTNKNNKSTLKKSISTLLQKSVLKLANPSTLVKPKEEVKLNTGAKWFDDYYTITYIDEKTIAIGEPRYWQKNFNYLILGEKEAILLDSGPGVRSIKPVVEALTSLPVISMVSHFHFDHIGNVNDFDTTILCKNQLESQECLDEHTLIPMEETFLGNLEGYDRKPIHVDTFVEPYAWIDLENRKVQVIPVPGHAYHSIALYDGESKQLFAGDYLMPGVLLVNSMLSPGGSLEECTHSANKLVELIDEQTITYCTHAMDYSLPQLAYKDILDLASFLNHDKVKEGMIPKYKKINDNMKIIY